MIGPYELRRELGRGAMAVVWLAWDARLEREVAIKEPLAVGSHAEEFAARFVREGRAAAQLNHPGIVTVHAAGVFDGRSAIVMERLSGETLGSLIDRGPLDPSVAASVLDQLLDAVGFAHSNGVVHRDIKPDNIFVTDDGRVKLTDFGIAHVGSDATLTLAGAVMGTPGYMSPEQVTGSPVDERSDLFAIGVIGYEMLTGCNPFGGRDLAPTAVMYRVVHEQPPQVSFPPEMQAAGPIIGACLRAMSKSPASRFPNAYEFRTALRSGYTTPAQAAAVGPVASANDTTAVYAQSQLGAAATGGQVRWLPYVAVIGIAAIVIGALLWTSSPGGGAQAARSGPAEPPVVMITSPSAGSSFETGEQVTVSVSVTSDADIGLVIVSVDGVEVGRDDIAPYEVVFTAASGTQSVTATAQDVSGQLATSTEVKLSVVEGSAEPAEAPEPSTAQSSPSDAVRDYYAALNDHDADAAYALRSKSFRSKTSAAKFARQARGVRDSNIIELSETSSSGSRASVYIEVEIVNNGTGGWETWMGEITLIRENGEWHVDSMGALHQ